MLTDVRSAMRSVRRRPGFSLVIVVTLALGIGATTAIFSVVNAILLRPLPVFEPERLITVEAQTEQGRFESVFSLPEYLEYRAFGSAAADIAAHHLDDITLNTGQQTSVTIGLVVSGNYFDVLGVRPAVGRFFSEDEACGPGAAPVVVISHDVWLGEMGGDAAVLGRTVHVNGQPLTVIGVAPAGFYGTMIGARPRAWLPIGLYDRLNPGADPYTWGRSEWLMMFGRLQPGIEAAQATAVLSAGARRLAATHEYREGAAPTGVRLRTFTAVPPSMRDGVRGFMALLLATAGLVLAIAAVNVAGMLLARGADRGREVAIQLALGAGRRRVLRQLLVESVILALAGGILGVLLASWLTDLFSDIRHPFAGALQLDVGIDTRVLIFSGVVSVATGVLFGLAPAFHSMRHDITDALKGGAARPQRVRLRRVMVAGQLALSLVLLVAAGLFFRTLQYALSTRHPFDPNGVLALELNLRISGYDEMRGRAFYDQLVERVRALPAAESAALASVIPLGFSWDQLRVRVPGVELPPGDPGVPVGYSLVSPEYFATLRMPLLAGRTFEPADRDGGTLVVIVNEAVARRFWPDESAIGKTLRSGSTEAQVIGVVPTGKYQSFSEEPVLFMYMPFGPMYASAMWLHVRARGDLEALAAAIRAELRALDSNVAPIAVLTMDDALGGSLFAQRLAATWVGGFGVVGLLLAAVGVFGLLSFLVAQRTREIGLRMALGAERATVIRLVIADGLKLLSAGLVVGLAVALATTRFLASLLHGVSPQDPVALAAVAALLVGVTVVAALLPASRAARVEPMEALRYE